MMLENIDFAWSFVLMFVAILAVWRAVVTRREPWKMWPWHAALAIMWGVSVPINFGTGDYVFAWIGIALTLLEAFNWFMYQDEAKERRAKVEENSRKEFFERLRIDDLPKN